MSVIALLIGILLPALGAAREASRGVVCLSNMRQMGIAVQIYAQEFDFKLPEPGLDHGFTPQPDDPGAWLFALNAYVDTDLMYRCPSDNSPYWDTPVTGTRFRRVSYATNYLLSDDFVSFLVSGTNPYSDLENIRRPSDTIYAVELAERNPQFAAADHVHPDGWIFVGKSEIAKQVEHEQHAGKANYLFLDGHAEQLALEETFPVGNYFAQPEANRYDPRSARDQPF